jgi:hypothetical protein
MVSRLFPAGADPGSSFTTTGANIGNRFHVTGDGYQVTNLLWYRPSGGLGGPAKLTLYDDDTPAIITSVTAPDNGSVGWQSVLISAETLISGTHYQVVGNWPASSSWRFSTAGVAPDSPLTWDGGRFAGPSSPETTRPTSVSVNEFGLDVLVSPPGGGGGGTPATETDLANAMTDWLDTSAGTQANSAPLQDHATLATVRSVVGSTSGQLDATKSVADAIHDLLTATNKNLGTLWDLAGHLADLEIAAWQGFFHAGAQRLTGPDSAGGSAFYTADGNLVSQLVAETWQRVRVLRGDIGFGTDGWTMSATADFTDAIAFAEPADAYVLAITSYEDTQPATESPAGLWLPRLGWWCVLTGSLASQRQFVDFEQMLLADQGRRMSGCAIQLRPGTLATVQAWLLA